MRLFGSECSSVLSVLATAVGIAAIFPVSALRFRPFASEASERTSSVAFVTLDERTEADFLRIAKETWRKKADGTGKVYANLMYAELPEGDRSPILPTAARLVMPDPPPAVGGLSPYLPSLRASAPQRIEADVQKERLPFSREELLKID